MALSKTNKQSETMQKNVAPTKTVKIWTTAGAAQTITTTANTWGELKPDLAAAGISYQEMTVINQNKQTLEVDGAVISDGTKLFLMPAKTKSGASSVREVVKGLVNGDNAEKAKKHFNKDQNYTRKSNVELEKLVASWNKKYGQTSASTTSAKPATGNRQVSGQASKKTQKEEPKSTSNKTARTTSSRKIADRQEEDLDSLADEIRSEFQYAGLVR